MSLLCSECLMRYRMEAVAADGTEPSLDDEDHLSCFVNPARTVLQGMALCFECLVRCVQVQRSSALVAPNGGQLVVPQLAVAR